MPSAAWGAPGGAGCEAAERLRSEAGIRSSHSWLIHLTPVLPDQLKTSCSRYTGEQSMTCLSCSLGFSEPAIMALVPIPYFAITIQICRVHDRGTAVSPHHVDSDGCQGDDVIKPSAPVCWLTPHSSFWAISTRSIFRPLSIWCRMAIFFCHICGVPVCEAETAEVPWGTYRSRGSVGTTCAACRATFLDCPIRPVIPASEMLVNCRPGAACFRTPACETRRTSANSVRLRVVMHAMPESTRFQHGPAASCSRRACWCRPPVA